MNGFSLRERDRVLVFGGATIFGSRLVERLMEMRLRVIAIDDLQIGSIENLSRALATGATTFVYARDLGDADMVRSALRNADCRSDIPVVHHCASPTSVDVAIGIASEMRARSVVAVRGGLVAVSTVVEAPTCVTRIHGLYGPHVFESPELETMFDAARAHLPVRARRGAIMRPLTYLDDAVAGMIAAMNRTQHGIFDVAGALNVLEEDVAGSLAALSGVHVEFGPDVRLEDGAEVEWKPIFPEPLGWVPRVSLHDGLRRTWRAVSTEPSRAS